MVNTNNQFSNWPAHKFRIVHCMIWASYLLIYMNMTWVAGCGFQVHLFFMLQSTRWAYCSWLLSYLRPKGGPWNKFKQLSMLRRLTWGINNIRQWTDYIYWDHHQKFLRKGNVIYFFKENETVHRKKF